jgi:hypothetical protein
MSSLKMEESRTTPAAWVDMLDENDADLARVRLLWRRGKGRYRPLVRDGIDPTELENASSTDWDACELPDSNLVWAVESGERPDARRRRLKHIATQLWTVAQHWARDRGPVIDFQLRGYGDDGGILFEVGKRYKNGNGNGNGNGHARRSRDEDETELDVDDERERERDRERDREREFVRRREDRLLGDFDQLHRTYAELLTRLARERNEAMTTTQETTRVTPNLLTSAGEILKDAIEYQRTQVTNLLDQASGRRELDAIEIRERYRTQRQDQSYLFVRDIFTTVVGVGVPLALQLSQIWTSRTGHALPEFKVAQQAMAYLGLTLNAHQLRMLFSSDESSNSFLDTLGEAAQRQDEREAIMHLVGLEKLFRSRLWADVVTPEQQIAARFILGRAAIYRIATFGEE